eukprot:CAMPEP_0117593312 /NCGR_PEP_ID=MMETSP0784-20121206/72564_1 /TAXON_ID=39447 /ORGANISM="" /LENGTH=114 /DNA_ID=CAMNT_0005395223 /DNA_START=95 /DNA_END=436 /DNA_ORIENTATION=+
MEPDLEGHDQEGGDRTAQVREAEAEDFAETRRPCWHDRAFRARALFYDPWLGRLAPACDDWLNDGVGTPAVAVRGNAPPAAPTKGTSTCLWTAVAPRGAARNRSRFGTQLSRAL